jgi:hypothetical protein
MSVPKVIPTRLTLTERHELVALRSRLANPTAPSRKSSVSMRERSARPKIPHDARK